jgi:hypothetical protein
MEGRYIAFTRANEPEHELLRVYPSELRRQYVPTPGQGTQNISPVEWTIMRMQYTNSDCIVRLGCSQGVSVLFDAVVVILNVPSIRRH